MAEAVAEGTLDLLGDVLTARAYLKALRELLGSGRLVLGGKLVVFK